MERRYQSQLQNMKDRLEQSDSTNRSLQNYVQFLKTSYGNVFGDSLLTSWLQNLMSINPFLKHSNRPKWHFLSADFNISSL